MSRLVGFLDPWPQKRGNRNVPPLPRRSPSRPGASLERHHKRGQTPNAPPRSLPGKSSLSLPNRAYLPWRCIVATYASFRFSHLGGARQAIVRCARTIRCYTRSSRHDTQPSKSWDRSVAFGLPFAVHDRQTREVLRSALLYLHMSPCHVKLRQVDRRYSEAGRNQRSCAHLLRDESF